MDHSIFSKQRHSRSRRKGVLHLLFVCTVLISLFFPAALADSAAENSNPRCFALLISNGQYLNTEMYELPSAYEDTAAMKNALEGMNPAWIITEAHDVTGACFVPAMENAFRDAGEDDICLFYYAGHGSYDADNHPGALKGIDAGMLEENYADAFLSTQELGDTLERLCPGKVIVILESCGSGSAIYNGEPLTGLVSPVTDIELLNSDEMTRVGGLRRKRFTVAAATEHGDWAYPFPDDDPRLHGIFSYCILEALGCSPDGTYTGSMPGDQNGDGMLTLGELMDYTRSLYQELRPTLPEDFPFQAFQFYGDRDTILFRR